MKEYIDKEFALSKKCETVNRAASAQICSKPCFLFTVIECGSANATERLTIHDGHSTVGRVMIELSVTNTFDRQTRFRPPMYFAQGIYLDVDSNTEGVTFHFITEDNCY